MSERILPIVIPPPHSLEAELGVLSSAMQGGPAAIEECQSKLTEEAFFYPSHAVLFWNLRAAYASQIPVELITFTQLLRDARDLDELNGEVNGYPCKGAAFLTSVWAFVGGASMLGHYIEIVREKWMLRQMIELCTRTARRCLENQDEAAGVLQDLQSSVVDIGQLASSNDSLVHAKYIVPEVEANIEATYRNRGHPMGIATGFNDLDRVMGGWRPAWTYVIAARPAMGKTSLALEFAEEAAISAMVRDAHGKPTGETGIPVAFFSVEMTKEDVIESILLRRAKTELSKLRTGMFSKEQRAEVMAQARALCESKLYIDDTAGLSVFEFRSRARRAVVKHGVRLIIIDYIGLMRSASKRAQGNRELEISEIMQGIVDTAKEMRVPIVVLSQLNREAERRSAAAVPKLSDLRESGSIEQGADFVGMLYRPSYYAQSDAQLQHMAEEREMSTDEFKQVAELIIAKHRRGPVGTVPLRFIKEFAHFESEDPTRPLYSNDNEERQRGV